MNRGDETRGPQKGRRRAEPTADAAGQGVGPAPPSVLEREEYVEQAYFFHALGERLTQQLSTQEILTSIKEEILSTAKLPLAIDFLASELRLYGVFATAMLRLSHYFTPFQTFVIAEAEDEHGRFDFAVALEILEREARYRAEGATPQGIFLYEFETICRNRLGYDRGLDAVSRDPIFDEDWAQWIRTVRRQIGIIDFADLIYVRSAYYLTQKARQTGTPQEPEMPVLFGEKEGKIALANRHKDPLLLFAALERHLGYPSVSRPKPRDESQDVLPILLKRVERLETRTKLLEEEQKGGIDLSRFYDPPRE